MKKILILIFTVFLLHGCAHSIATTFPAADKVFITTGDGDIQKPYTPIGQIYYAESGFRIPLPILGLIPIKDVDVDYILQSNIFNKVRTMGGDALIKMKIKWEPASSGFLGFAADGGRVIITGTVIKR